MVIRSLKAESSAMQLQKQKTRVVKGKAYYRWMVVIPPKEVERLGWAEGQDLTARLVAGRLVLKRAVTPVPNQAGKTSMGAMLEVPFASSPEPSGSPGVNPPMPTIDRLAVFRQALASAKVEGKGETGPSGPGPSAQGKLGTGHRGSGSAGSESSVLGEAMAEFEELSRLKDAESGMRESLVDSFRTLTSVVEDPIPFDAGLLGNKYGQISTARLAPDASILIEDSEGKEMVVPLEELSTEQVLAVIEDVVPKLSQGVDQSDASTAGATSATENQV